MTFATDRLLAERLDPRHLDDLAALHLDPEVARHLGGVRSAAETAAYLDANLAHWRQHGFGLWVLRTLDRAFAGRAGIRRVVVENQPEVEIAYTFRRDLWGRGLATETALALAALWRTDLPTIPSLAGIASLDNAASRRVLQKTGFALERNGTCHGAAVAIYRLTR